MSICFVRNKLYSLLPGYTRDTYVTVSPCLMSSCSGLKTSCPEGSEPTATVSPSTVESGSCSSSSSKVVSIVSSPPSLSIVVPPLNSSRRSCPTPCRPCSMSVIGVIDPCRRVLLPIPPTRRERRHKHKVALLIAIILFSGCASKSTRLSLGSVWSGLAAFLTSVWFEEDVVEVVRSSRSKVGRRQRCSQK